jgi:hypothetical protein
MSSSAQRGDPRVVLDRDQEVLYIDMSQVKKKGSKKQPKGKDVSKPMPAVASRPCVLVEFSLHHGQTPHYCSFDDWVSLMQDDAVREEVKYMSRINIESSAPVQRIVMPVSWVRGLSLMWARRTMRQCVDILERSDSLEHRTEVLLSDELALIVDVDERTCEFSWTKSTDSTPMSMTWQFSYADNEILLECILTFVLESCMLVVNPRARAPSSGSSPHHSMPSPHTQSGPSPHISAGSSPHHAASPLPRQAASPLPRKAWPPSPAEPISQAQMRDYIVSVAVNLVTTNGQVTPEQITLETGASVDEIQPVLDELVDNHLLREQPQYEL